MHLHKTHEKQNGVSKSPTKINVFDIFSRISKVLSFDRRDRGTDNFVEHSKIRSSAYELN